MLRNSRSVLIKGVAAPTQYLASSRRLSIAVPSPRRSNTPVRPAPLHIVKAQYASGPPHTMPKGINPEEEKKAGERKLEAHPESVTTESSVRHFIEPSKSDKLPPVSEGVKEDLGKVKEAFALSTVPKESYWLGLAGTLPYLGTSASTVYLSWILNSAWPSSSSFVNSLMINQDTARQTLAMLEPIQLGYGAIIISFLGAIHWGLEYAEKAPDRTRTRFRYGMGVVASAVAWPTLLMPVEFALTAQFAAFVALYFADARATVRGWTPYWYTPYRFVLTAVVGVAIVLSLIGRAKVGDAAPRLSGLGEKFHEQHGEQQYSEKWEKEEQKEKERLKKEKAEAEKKKKEEEKKAKEAEKKSAKSSKKDKQDDDGKQSDQSNEKKGEQSEDEKKGDEKKGDEDEGEKKSSQSENKQGGDGKEEKKSDDSSEKQEGK